MSLRAAAVPGAIGDPGARARLAWVLLLLLPLLLTGDLSRLALARVAAFALAATGISVLTGLAGQVSLGHAALMAAGGYTSAGLAVHAGWPVAASALAGVAVAVAAGLVLGLPSLRLRGQYLALATLAGGFIAYQIIRQDPHRWTGGDLGLAGIPPASAAGSALGPLAMALLALGLLAGALIFAANLASSRAGRAFRAVRDGEAAAAVSGISVYRIKVAAFALSAVLAGVGGTIVAHGEGFLAAGSFAPAASLLLVVAAVVGGLASPAGGLLGTALILGPSEIWPAVFGPIGDYRMLAWGPVALLIVFRWPGGIAGAIENALELIRRRPPAPPAPPAREPASPAREPASAAGEFPAVAGDPQAAAALARPGSPPPAGAPALEARGITVRYGGVLALDRVDLTVRTGSIHALIGPNGSGKTTLLDVLCGFIPPGAGTVRIAGGRAVAPGGRAPGSRRALSPHGVSRAGAGRTFQTVGVFGAMSALDNVLAGAHGRFRGGVLAGGLGLGDGDAIRREARDLLAAVGLAGTEDAPARTLSYGQRKRLELARALAARPWLVFLDEPAAGRNEPEILELGRLLVALRDVGITILLVEHHMNFVLAVADTVTCLDEGRVIADGPPAVVRDHPNVAAAYLGAAPNGEGAS